jgi:hypothetical protein
MAARATSTLGEPETATVPPLVIDRFTALVAGTRLPSMAQA